MGISVDINPVLVAFGPVAVRWYGLLALIGLGSGIWWTVRQVPRKPVMDALAWAIPIGVLSARLVHFVGWWSQPGAIWDVHLEQLSLWGGLIGGALAAAARLRRTPSLRRRVFEAAAPGVALAIAIGQLGAFIDGQAQGLPSDLPWATRYTNPLAAVPDFRLARHPAQIYDGLVALGLFVLLPRLRLGLRWWSGVLVYGLARIGLGAVRLDPAFLFGLQLEQILAGWAVGIAVVHLARHAAARAAVPKTRSESLAA